MSRDASEVARRYQRVVLSLATAPRSWWSRRRASPPLAGTAGVSTSSPSLHRPDPAGEAPQVVPDPTRLWRLRATVRDEPGSLATLCAALAALRVDVLSLQTHPLEVGTVDEFVLRAPGGLCTTALVHAVTAAGGRDVATEPAEARELVDTPTQVLALATRTALDPAELPSALRGLLGRCVVRSTGRLGAAASRGIQEVPPEGVLEERRMLLPSPEGEVISVERSDPPFTPTEFARARALVGLDARLGPRTPPGREEDLPLCEGGDVTVRRAGIGDLRAAGDMHRRCSRASLRLRYHGPVHDADRYLRHLLGPHFGRTLAVLTDSGRIVGLGHMMWDGDDTEIALLVEDAWQRRGVGRALLARLVSMAADAGCGSVYAVTQPSNTGMIASMRGLGLPLDYRFDDGTLVVTARLEAAAPAGSPHPPEGPVVRG
ncbi:GNAT family N-acetyltransferase [Streptomyces sp. ZYX-F-203]